MKRRIELHDSNLKSVVTKGSDLILYFDGFSVLDVTDDFGFEWDKTTFEKGQIILKNAKYENLPSAGRLSDGKVRISDISYDLIPIDLKTSGKCLLSLEKDGSVFKLFCESVEVSLKGE